MLVSVVIPIFNEQGEIGRCLESLMEQSFKDLEIIVVDDGSTDGSLELVSVLAKKNSKLKVLVQSHLGAGMARNFGVSKASGQIIVFVDGDMVFAKNFIAKLIKPIQKTAVIGTFSKEELVLNKDNIWSQCWNLNKGLAVDRMHPKNYPDHQKVFRAILKTKFQEAGGFKPIGYIDDYTLSESLGVEAVSAPGAYLYHNNPDNLAEVFQQARWIGKSEYMRRKIQNEQTMKMVSLIRYSLPMTLFKGLTGAIKYRRWRYLIFKIVYDFGVELSLIGSLFNEQKYK